MRKNLRRSMLHELFFLSRLAVSAKNHRLIHLYCNCCKNIASSNVNWKHIFSKNLWGNIGRQNINKIRIFFVQIQARAYQEKLSIWTSKIKLNSEGVCPELIWSRNLCKSVSSFISLSSCSFIYFFVSKIVIV